METLGLRGRKLAIFDLDGTLTESKQPLDVEMAQLFRKLLLKMKVAVVSGGSFTQFKNQFLRSLVPTQEEADNLSILPTSGAAYYKHENGEWKVVYEVKLSDKEVMRITEALQGAVRESGFSKELKTYGDTIEARGGQVTYSALGQNAPIDVKKGWDPDQEKRKVIVSNLTDLTTDFNVRIGGATSIDVTKKGIDKEYGVRKLSELLGISLKDIAYVGDALFEGGNDEPAMRAGVDCIKVGTVTDTKKLITDALN